MRHIAVWIAALLVIAQTVGPSRAAIAAAMDAKTVQIVAKTFDFLSHRPPANAKIVVVNGAADMAAVRSSLGRMTIAEGAPGDVAGAFAVFVNSPEEARSARGVNANVLTVSNDVDCVNAGACLMAVETQPKVTIYVSRAVAQAVGVEFDPNFKMLITEK
jgi:hypothetical protein